MATKKIHNSAQTGSRLGDIGMVLMVTLMSVAANLPDTFEINFDKRYLLAALMGIVGVSLIKYLKFALVLVVVVLAVGANLPEHMASEMNVNQNVMLFALVAMVIVSLANHAFKLPTGLEQTRSQTDRGPGGSALYGAISKGRLSTVKAILDQGVNVNIRTPSGQTPLMFASYKGFGDIIQLLIDRGADIHAKDKDGKTALNFATQKGYTRAVDLLRSSGAQM
ncbi:MAG: ankyrin repeat domain-containing protein [Gammaproteobacteria bacterium]|nr:ankyrin repeat domain-containing protein [Gammaproteobacteria bacterium]